MDSTEVTVADCTWPVERNGARLGEVFEAKGSFWFLLDDRLDGDGMSRRGFSSVAEAMTACEHTALCMAMAEKWDDDRALLMLDT